MERKIALSQRTATWGEGGPVAKDQLSTDHQWVVAFKGKFQGCISGQKRLHTEIAQSTLSVILKSIMQLSDQHHLDCSKYIQSSAPGLVCSHFSEVNSLNCGSVCQGNNLVIM